MLLLCWYDQFDDLDRDNMLLDEKPYKFFLSFVTCKVMYDQKS